MTIQILTTVNQWQLMGTCLILVNSPIQAAPSVPPQVSVTHCYIPKNSPQKGTEAKDYVERVRRNPRRKAAMDKAMREIAAQLAGNGQTIIALRLAKGFTQSELARAAGLKQSYLSRIENCRCTISDTNIGKIANVLDSTPDEIRAAFKNHWAQTEQLS